MEREGNTFPVITIGAILTVVVASVIFHLTVAVAVIRAAGAITVTTIIVTLAATIVFAGREVTAATSTAAG